MTASLEPPAAVKQPSRKRLPDHRERDDRLGRDTVKLWSHDGLG